MTALNTMQLWHVNVKMRYLLAYKNSKHMKTINNYFDQWHQHTCMQVDVHTWIDCIADNILSDFYSTVS